MADLNVQSYGAVGDGLTDDSAAFSAALTAASPGQVVVVPYTATGYRINSGITIPGGVTLRGDTARIAELIFYTNASTPAITLATSYYSVLNRIRLRHASKGTSQAGIYTDGGANNAAYGTLSDVVIDGFQTGVRATGEHSWLKFKDVHVINCVRGWHMDHVNMPVFDRCITDQTDHESMFFDSVENPIINDCTVQYSGLTGAYSGIEALDTVNMLINTLWAEGNRFHTIYLRGASHYASVRNGRFAQSGNVSGSGWGIRVEGTCSSTLIDGAWFDSNASGDIYCDGATAGNRIINCRKSSAIAITDNSSGTLRLSNAGEAGLVVGNTANINANALDWYEEGTFTPVVQGSTVAGSGTYSTQSGRFTRIGNCVHFRLQIAWTAHTGTGNLVVAQLPYAAHPTTNAAVNVLAANLSFAGQLSAYVIAGNPLVYLMQVSSGAGILNVTMDTAATVWVAGSYCV